MEEIKIIKRNLIKTLVVKDGETVNLETISVFNKPKQKGNILIKAVVMGKGKLNLKGKIKIKKGAELSEAFLKQTVLLIGEESSAIAIPELEIETDDVRASHAASVGRVDEEEVFYLQSRGLTRAEAVELIIEAFLS